MKLIVFGAGGMAGHVMSLSFLKQGDEVTAFARTPLPFCDTIVGDVTDQSSVLSALRAKSYDAIINCAGVLNAAVDANPAIGIDVNSVFPHRLAAYVQEQKTRIVHISTDCVFSGKENGGYTERSICDANTLYGRSKALGELHDEKNLTIRTSIVGPDLRKDGTGLFHWFMNQKECVKGYRQVFWTGVTTIELAKAVRYALLHEMTGLCHLVNGEKISKYKLLSLFDSLRCDPTKVVPCDKPCSDKSLATIRNDFIGKILTYGQMMEELKLWVSDYSRYYPHYEGSICPP